MKQHKNGGARETNSCQKLVLKSFDWHRQVRFCFINLSDWVKSGLCQEHYSHCCHSGERGATSTLLGLYLHFKSPVISSWMKEGSNFTDCVTGATRRGRRTAARPWRLRATTAHGHQWSDGKLTLGVSEPVSDLFLGAVHHEIYGKYTHKHKPV